MLLPQGISSLVGHSRLQRLGEDRWQSVQPAHLSHHHTHKQVRSSLLQRLPVSIVVAAGAVNNGEGSGEAKKPARLCRHQGCFKQASYGKPGEKSQFCAEHAPEGTENVKHKKCEHEGCTKVPSYGVPGGRRQFCKEHKPEGMVPLTGYRCQHEACVKRASFAFPGEKARSCKAHAQPGMVASPKKPSK